MKEIQDIIRKNGQRVFYKEGKNIFSQGDTDDFFIFIERGVVTSEQSDENGNVRIIGISCHGEFVGLTGFFTEKPHIATSYALEDSVIYHISRESFEKNFMKNKEFLWAILKEMDRFMDAYAEEGMQLSTYRTVGSKLAYILLQLAEKFGERRGNDIFINCKTKDEVLGYMIGANRETVARELSKFKKEKWISKENKSIIIHDTKALEDLIIQY